jgi:hypothetical protein
MSKRNVNTKPIEINKGVIINGFYVTLPTR